MPVSRGNGLDIAYEVAGAGPPLVLIHALPFDHNLWLYQVERFSARFRTLAMDLRGWGRSAKPRTAFLLGDMASDILGVLADEGMTADAIVWRPDAELLRTSNVARFMATDRAFGKARRKNQLAGEG